MSNAVEVKVPDIGDYKNIPVIEVFVKPGDSVNAEDSLLTLDTRTEAGRRILMPMATKLDGFVSCDERVFDAVRDLIDIK